MSEFSIIINDPLNRREVKIDELQDDEKRLVYKFLKKSAKNENYLEPNVFYGCKNAAGNRISVMLSHGIFFRPHSSKGNITDKIRAQFVDNKLSESDECKVFASNEYLRLEQLLPEEADPNKTLLNSKKKKVIKEFDLFLGVNSEGEDNSEDDVNENSNANTIVEQYKSLEKEYYFTSLYFQDDFTKHSKGVKFFLHKESTRTGFVMPKIEGKTFIQYLEEMQPSVTLAEKLAIAYKLMGDFEKIHALGIVHHDVSAANFVIDNSNLNNIKVKLIDFGNSEKIGEKNITMPIGTINYTSPESLKRIGKDKITNYDDVDLVQEELYSIGIVLLELIAGKSFFKYFVDFIEKNYKEEVDARVNEYDENEDDCYDPLLMEIFKYIHEDPKCFAEFILFLKRQFGYDRFVLEQETVQKITAFNYILDALVCCDAKERKSLSEVKTKFAEFMAYCQPNINIVTPANADIESEISREISNITQKMLRL